MDTITFNVISYGHKGHFRTVRKDSIVGIFESYDPKLTEVLFHDDRSWRVVGTYAQIEAKLLEGVK